MIMLFLIYYKEAVTRIEVHAYSRTFFDSVCSILMFLALEALSSPVDSDSNCTTVAGITGFGLFSPEGQRAGQRLPMTSSALFWRGTSSISCVLQGPLQYSPKMKR